jgi:hypothetical protein
MATGLLITCVGGGRTLLEWVGELIEMWRHVSGRRGPSARMLRKQAAVARTRAVAGQCSQLGGLCRAPSAANSGPVSSPQHSAPGLRVRPSSGATTDLARVFGAPVQNRGADPGMLVFPAVQGSAQVFVHVGLRNPFGKRDREHVFPF